MNAKPKPQTTYWILRDPIDKGPAVAFQKEAFVDAYEWIIDLFFRDRQIYATPEKLTDADRTKHGYKLEKWAIRDKRTGEVLAFVYKDLDIFPKG